MKRTNEQLATWRKGYIVTGVLAVVLILLAVMPLSVSAASDYDHQAIREFEQPGFASLDADAAFEPMSIDAFGDVGIAPHSGGTITWQPHAPVVTMPAGQDFVDIYFTLDRPGGVATPMGNAATSLVLRFPLFSIMPAAPIRDSVVFHEPNPIDYPYFNGILTGFAVRGPFNGYLEFGGNVAQLFHGCIPTNKTWDHYGDIVVRVRMGIPVGAPEPSPLDDPAIGYTDVTVRRGRFTAEDGTIFGYEYSTVRIAREVSLSFENLPARGLTHVGQSVEQNNNLLLSAPGTAQAAAGSTTILDAGTVEGYTFLGWFRQIGPNSVPIPAPGDTVPNIPESTIHTFVMPGEKVHYVAVWGNSQGVVCENYHIAFHIYTGNQGLINRFSNYGTLNEQGILVINVPVRPGEPSSQWPNQNLLNAALSVGNVLGVAGTPGHAFWGWFRGETLDNSGRFGSTGCAENPNPTNPGLRRPLLTDRCEWMNDGMDTGPQSRIFDMLQNPSITQAQKDELFGSNGILDLFAIWSLWGDVNDDDIVCITDLNILRTYLLFRTNFPDIRDLNRRAADVLVTDSLDWTDFNLLEAYLLTRSGIRPGQHTLGVRPMTSSSAFESFNAARALEPMSVAAFTNVGIAPHSGGSITWQPHEPVITMPIGQNYVDIYFTLDRPDGAARPISATSLVLSFPLFSLMPANPMSNSVAFHEPSMTRCTCCNTHPNPYFRGTLSGFTIRGPFDGLLEFGGTVMQMHHSNPSTGEMWDYYGDIVVRVRLTIPVNAPLPSPLDDPAIGYQDVTIRRGLFTTDDGTIFGYEYSTVRIVREGSPAA